LVAVLSLAPAWLLVPVPVEYQSNPPAPPPAVVEERPAPATSAPSVVPEAPAWLPDDAVAAGEGAIVLPPVETPALPRETLEAPVPPAAETPSPADTHFTLTTLCHWLGVAYAVVAAAFALRLLWNHLRLWRLLRSARPAPPAAARLFAELAS